MKWRRSFLQGPGHPLFLPVPDSPLTILVLYPCHFEALSCSPDSVQIEWKALVLRATEDGSWCRQIL